MPGPGDTFQLGPTWESIAGSGATYWEIHIPGHGTVSNTSLQGWTVSTVSGTAFTGDWVVSITAPASFPLDTLNPFSTPEATDFLVCGRFLFGKDGSNYQGKFSFEYDEVSEGLINAFGHSAIPISEGVTFACHKKEDGLLQFFWYDNINEKTLRGELEGKIIQLSRQRTGAILATVQIPKDPVCDGWEYKIMRSKDLGLNWEEYANVPWDTDVYFCRGAYCGPNNELYSIGQERETGTQGMYLIRNNGDGVFWTDPIDMGSVLITALSIDSRNQIMTPPRKSRDGGFTWQSISVSGFALTPIHHYLEFGNGQLAVCSVNDNVLKFQIAYDQQTFRPAVTIENNPELSIFLQSPLRIVPFGNSGIIDITNSRDKQYRSRDGGKTWQVMH